MDIENLRKDAGDLTTPPNVLAELAQHEDRVIRRYVAANPSTSVATLQQLGLEFPTEITNNPVFNLLLLENPDSKFVRLS